MLVKLSRKIQEPRFCKMLIPKKNIFTTPSFIQFRSDVMQPAFIETVSPNLEKPLKQNIINICCLKNKRVSRQLKIVESLLKKSNYNGVTFNFNNSLDATVYFYNEKHLFPKTDDNNSLRVSFDSYFSRVPIGQNVLVVGSINEEKDLKQDDLEKILNMASIMSVNTFNKSFNKIFVSKDTKKNLTEYFDRNGALRSRIMFEDDIFSMLNVILQNENFNKQNSS